MKTLLIGITIVAISSAAQSKCEDRALKEFHKLYKEECNGYGNIDSCQLHEAKTSTKFVKWHGTCLYSGEPDYIDNLDAVLSFSLKDCSLVSVKIKECYTN